MTMVAEPELLTPNYDPSLKVEDVREVAAMSDPAERFNMTEALAGYLCTSCTVEEIFDHASIVERLYDKSSTVQAKFKAKDVDVFAEAATFTLEQLGTDEAKRQVKELERVRRIISNQQHVRYPEPFWRLNFRLVDDGYYSGSGHKFPPEVYGAD